MWWQSPGIKLETLGSVEWWRHYYHTILDPHTINIEYDFSFQADMLRSLATTRPTVNEQGVKKFEKFTQDFGQEG